MFLLEGNIGVGKTTFLGLIEKKCPEIDVVREPVKNWTQEDFGQSLLGNFYQSPSRWAFTLETFAMVSRLMHHVTQQGHQKNRFVMERSIFSGHYCFAMNGRESGFFNEVEWDVYCQWVDFFFSKNFHPPLGFIYLRATPERCFKRVSKRSRRGEESLTLEYMRSIHSWHEKFLVEKAGVFERLKKVPVLVLDCENDFEADEEVLEGHLSKIKNFVGGGFKDCANVL
jgi:deoxycitidine kinase